MGRRLSTAHRAASAHREELLTSRTVTFRLTASKAENPTGKSSRQFRRKLLRQRLV
jgi:hypothetical protein